jgi:hypothetical protein
MSGGFKPQDFLVRLHRLCRDALGQMAVAGALARGLAQARS